MVVTNAHSIRSTPTVVTFDGLTLRTRVLAYDADEDLAVLHVPGLDQPPIRRGDSRRLRAGEFVCAVGNPWGLPGTVTLGTVLGTGSRWRQPALDGKDLIVTDVLPRPGNSGGPLVDTEGRLVGIASMVIAPALGVAIPTHTIAEFARMVDA
jgi:serine protease Do